MWSKEFWKAVSERAIKTGAQGVLLVLGVAGVSAGVDTVQGEALNAFTWDYLTLGGSFLAGAAVSVLTSLVTAGVTNGSPSAGDAEILAVGGRNESQPPTV